MAPLIESSLHNRQLWSKSIEGTGDSLFVAAMSQGLEDLAGQLAAGNRTRSLTRAHRCRWMYSVKTRQLSDPSGDPRWDPGSAEQPGSR